MRDFVKLQLTAALSCCFMSSGKSWLGSAGSPCCFFVAVSEFLLGLSFVAEGAICGSREAQTNRAKVAVEV